MTNLQVEIIKRLKERKSLTDLFNDPRFLHDINELSELGYIDLPKPNPNRPLEHFENAEIK